ncbi:testis-expressed protein 12 [Diceros bicornis minor]|uniref:testis-expressed protein 12 n=1 Tax=Diceros bicornis minor TaxID=77932 RepID=UPI0026F1888C|nr:testis-expressed protein 12 [Diceros bicornis minor]
MASVSARPPQATTMAAANVPVPGEVSPLTEMHSGPIGCCLQNMMAGHLEKPDTRNCKRTRELEPQMPDSPQLSSLGKSDCSFSESSGLFYKDEALEKDLNDMSKEINLMLSTYAKILSERAAVDASYIDEIDGLFKEANTIENFLIQKRELLRQRFTVIANTLHR